MHLIDQQLNLLIRGRVEDAWRISQQLEAIKDNLPGDEPYRHRFNRAWFMLHRGEFQKGYQMLEAGRFLNVYGNPPIKSQSPLWDGKQDLNGRTVILALEAGAGDQIISARFANCLSQRGAKVIVCSHISLHCIFQRISGVSACITEDMVPRTPHDFWIPGFSACWLLGYDYETLPREPYISANPESVAIWKTALTRAQRRPRIGIRWSGNPEFEHQQFRKFAVRNLIDICDGTKADFYSLQRDTDLMELPEHIFDLQHLLLSWEDTAACVENLDLVITSCTSIAHIAGALGKPTWVILPILPYHTWAKPGDHSPWYTERTRLFRQSEFGEWNSVFALLKDELDKFIQSSAQLGENH